MEPRFRDYVERLDPSWRQLMDMCPVTPATLPRPAPTAVVYLLSEAGAHLYVGRTRNLKQRMGNHCNESSAHNQAVFAFKLASESSGITQERYMKGKGRAVMCENPIFNAAFTAAKARVRTMELRFVEERNPTRQALLELYVSIVLQTPYNDFDTH